MVDYGFSFIQSLKTNTFSLATGSLGITLLLVNRISIGLEGVSDLQSRADLLAVVACSAVLLNALSETEIEARDREAVGLVGYSLRKPVVFTPKNDGGNEIEWLCNTVVGPTPATSLHIIDSQGKVSCRAGVVGMGDTLEDDNIDITNMPILQKALNGEEVYLPDLQILPGKVEFQYLPINCQSVLILPMSNQRAAVLGTNQAKSIKLDDIAKIRSSLAIL